MHMRFKRILVSALMLSILMMECKSIFVAADVPFRLYDEKQAMEVVGKVVEAADSLDWDSFTQYMCNDEQKYYEYYFANEELQDGINYFLVVIAVEDGMLKIVQFNRPSAELLQEIVASELSVDDEEYSAELLELKL